MSTRRSDSPAFDRPDGGSSYQPKTPGTTFCPAQPPVGSKVWGRPFQRAGRSPRARRARGQGGALVAPRRERNSLYGVSIFLCYFLFAIEKESRSLLALHPAILQIHPGGVFCNLRPPRMDRPIRPVHATLYRPPPGGPKTPPRATPAAPKEPGAPLFPAVPPPLFRPGTGQ